MTLCLYWKSIHLERRSLYQNVISLISTNPGTLRDVFLFASQNCSFCVIQMKIIKTVHTPWNVIWSYWKSLIITVFSISFIMHLIFICVVHLFSHYLLTKWQLAYIIRVYCISALALSALWEIKVEFGDGVNLSPFIIEGLFCLYGLTSNGSWTNNYVKVFVSDGCNFLSRIYDLNKLPLKVGYGLVITSHL